MPSSECLLFDPSFPESEVLVMAKLTGINGLTNGSDRWAVKVGVFRRWKVYQKSAPGLLSCATMIFVDNEVIDHFFLCFLFTWKITNS